MIINQFKYNKIFKMMKFKYNSQSKLKTKNIIVQRVLKINKLLNNNRKIIQKKKFKILRQNNK